jgi:hypothetical protein
MKYTLIKGTFHVVGYSPDGDSLMFKARNQARWDKIVTDHREMLEEKLTHEGGALQLRLQGIDALETHYSPGRLTTPPELKDKEIEDQEKPSPGDHKQPEYLAKLAAEELMSMLGVKRAEWRSWGKHTWVDKIYVEKRGREVAIEDKQEDALPGYIVTRDVDRKGRPIAWVFGGSARDRDGTQLTQARLLSRLEQSANYQLLRQGLVYPYFFMTLPGRLRDKLSEAAQLAQAEAATLARSSQRELLQEAANIWLYDKTDTGIKVTSISKIHDEYEIYPYLFRKLIKHWYRRNMEKYWDALRADRAYSLRGSTRISLTGFFETGNPYIFVVSERDFVRLDEILSMKGNTLKMKKYPFDIVFLS